MTLISKILLLIVLVYVSQCAVTVNQITGVTTDNLLFTGTIPISASTNLFFTYYGVDGEKDQNLLKNSPLLIFVGKYLSYYLVLEHPHSIIHSEE
jgi:hypothetical protein